MSKFLKGNYIVGGAAEESDNVSQDSDFTRVFESKALERLGGSIAFVVKKDQFVWEGDDDV